MKFTSSVVLAVPVTVATAERSFTKQFNKLTDV